MIAADTSSMVAYFSGEDGEDVSAIRKAIDGCSLVLPPLVLTELFSDHKLPSAISRALKQLPVLEINTGYWQRAGELRSRVLVKKRKARIADSLIAQSCIDNQVLLVTRDSDFKNFVEFAGLEIVIQDKTFS